MLFLGITSNYFRTKHRKNCLTLSHLLLSVNQAIQVKKAQRSTTVQSSSEGEQGVFMDSKLKKH